MVILIVGILLVTIGFVIDKKYYSDPFALYLVGWIVVIVSIVFYCGAKYSEIDLSIEYEQDKAFIEECYNNENLTPVDRNEAIKIIVNDNAIINKMAYLKKNIFINIFVPNNIGDLELFDIKKLPKPVTAIELNNEIK
jgi:hypothetical protein